LGPDKRLLDFRNFLWLVWKHLNLPDPTPIQYDIAEYIQTGPKRLVVEAFRGVGKSWITSAFVIHQLLLDPTKNILVVSASKSRADDFSTFTLRLINEIELLSHLRPQEGQRNSKIAFDVGPAPAAHAPSVKSVGVTGQLTGSRADLIVADDVESANNSMTQVMRDKLSETVKEFDAVLKPDGRIIYLGTPQTEQSLYNSLPDRGYKIRVWPARYPSEKQMEIYGERLAPVVADAWEDSRVGHPTDPARFGLEDLMEREASYGRSGFNLQFMLDTSLSDMERYPLKMSDLIVMDVHDDVAPERLIWGSSSDLVVRDVPCVGFNGDKFYRPARVQGDYIPYTGSVLAVDPSGRGSDETAIAVAKMCNGVVYIPEAGGIAGGYSDSALKAIAETAKRHKVNYVIVESNFGDGMFTQLLTPVLRSIYPVTVEEVRHSKQKEKRIIDTLEPVLNQHKLVVSPSVIRADWESTRDLPTEKALGYQLFYQLTRITKDRGALRHDDRLDALAMAVGYWTEAMAQDVEARMEGLKQERLMKEMDKFTDAYFKSRGEGRPSNEITWMER
jgi:hypothetical protein